MAAPVRDGLAKARAALRAGDAAAARRVLEPALADLASGEVIEGLARASYLELEFVRAIEEGERAYAAYRASGERLGLVRVARTLSGMYQTILGDFAVGSGWLTAATA